ncbi:MAG: hypothetical protein IJ576_02090 [Synergistaceae bacterium]|nr:hypothetical protein [Synergistaceae bacterium]MBR1603730.1 hypothetical protein [Synergistaceae bacterium]
MKKIILTAAFGAAIAGVLAFSDVHNEADADTAGVYQCTVCTQIVTINNKSSVLQKFGLDGHKHEWHYIARPGETIRPIVPILM